MLCYVQPCKPYAMLYYVQTYSRMIPMEKSVARSHCGNIDVLGPTELNDDDCGKRPCLIFLWNF